MTQEQQIALMAPFTSKEVQWRLRNANENGGYAIPYLDSRAIQNRLDTVLGKGNWQNTFITTSTGNPKAPVTNICTISIYFPDRKEWIPRSDGAGSTDIEPIKGGLSDAFKRAASMWGIGRYMYELTDIWVDVEQKGKSKVVAKSSMPKLNDYYEKAIKAIFSGNSVEETPPAEKKKRPHMFTVESAKPSGKADNMMVELKSDGGQVTTVYTNGPVKFRPGQKLKDVQCTEKKHKKIGTYYILDAYKIAA